MKLRILSIVGLLFAVLIFNGCIKKAALNAEADITAATIENGEQLLENTATIGGDFITFRLKVQPPNYKFAPKFVLTTGATITPASGTELDFKTPQQYTVTSQDGHWEKTYKVSFVVNEPDFNYHFEDAEVDQTNKYSQFYSPLPGGQKVLDWGSGNLGFSLILSISGQSKTPEAYPTYQSEGYKGKGVTLLTKSTGSLGAAFHAPIAAGNLFMGDFVSVDMKDPRLGLNFGRAYNRNSPPVSLEGYYKYKAGANFEVHKAPSTLTKDTWDAYAVLFEKDPTNEYLNGTFTFSDPRIVGVARLDNSKYGEAKEWTKFEIPFQLIAGKSFDLHKKYMYTIVLSASKEGNVFNGAVGSKLEIDELQMVVE